MSQMKAGAFISYLAVGFNALAGLLYTPWMIEQIGTADYALYTLALSVVNFFLLDFGLSTATSRFLSSYYADGRVEDAQRFLGIIYKLYLLISAAILIALLIVYFNIDAIYASLGSEQLDTFKRLFLVIACYSVISFPCLVFNGVLTSKEEFISLNLCNLLQKVTCVLSIVLMLLLGYGVFALVLCNAFTSVLFSLVKYVLIRRRTDARANLFFWDASLLKEALSFSGWVVVSNIAGRFIFTIAPSVIAIVSNSSEVAFFGLATSLEGYVYSVAGALSGMFMPRVTQVLHEQGDGAPLQELMTRYGRVQLYLVGLIIVGFFVLGDRFVACWLGEGYRVVYLSASMLILPSLIDLPQMVANTALTAAGKVKEQAFVYVAMAVSNILITLPCTTYWGSTGAALSIMFSYLLRTLLFNAQYSRYLHIKTIRFYRDTFASWLPCALISAIACAVLSGVSPIKGWLGLMLLVLVFVLTYAPLCLKLSANAYERELAGSFLSHIKKSGK